MHEQRLGPQATVGRGASGGIGGRLVAAVIDERGRGFEPRRAVRLTGTIGGDGDEQRELGARRRIRRVVEIVPCRRERRSRFVGEQEVARGLHAAQCRSEIGVEPAQSRLVALLEQRFGEQGVPKLDDQTATAHETFELDFEPDGRRLDRAADQREPDERVRSAPVETLDASSDRVEQRQ